MFEEQAGRELKSIRNRLGYNLRQAQEITGINKNTLCIYENNTGILKLGKLFKILERYNVEPDIFFKNVCENIRKN